MDTIRLQPMEVQFWPKTKLEAGRWNPSDFSRCWFSFGPDLSSRTDGTAPRAPNKNASPILVWGWQPSPNPRCRGALGSNVKQQQLLLRILL
jgi:hypothetical protein